MEFLKNLISPVSERVKSPFYGAFFISWLLVNWRVLLAFFSGSELIEGVSKYQFIAIQLQYWDKTILYPISLSLIYLLILPWLDYLMFWYGELVKKAKTKRKLSIGKSYYVSGETYYNLWDRYKTQKEELGKALSEVEATEREAYDLQIDNSKKEDTITALTSELNKLRKEFEEKFKPKSLDEVMEGQWKHSYRFETNETYEREKVLHVDHSNTQLSEKVKGGSTTYGYIDFIIISPDSLQIKFIFSTDDFKKDFQRVILKKEKNARGIERYIGHSYRSDGKTAEVYFEKLLP